VQLTLISITTETEPTARVTEAVIIDVLWAAVRPEDAVEHISVRLECRHITIGLFRSGDGRVPDITGDALISRAREMSPIFGTGPLQLLARSIYLALPARRPRRDCWSPQ
jgi:hypothetical protein